MSPVSLGAFTVAKSWYNLPLGSLAFSPLEICGRFFCFALASAQLSHFLVPRVSCQFKYFAVALVDSSLLCPSIECAFATLSFAPSFITAAVSVFVWCLFIKTQNIAPFLVLMTMSNLMTMSSFVSSMPVSSPTSFQPSIKHRETLNKLKLPFGLYPTSVILTLESALPYRSLTVLGISTSASTGNASPVAPNDVLSVAFSFVQPVLLFVL